MCIRDSLTPLPFWINARTQLTPLKENLIWLAETEHINYHEAFDISFSWKWMHDTEDYCKGQKTINDLLATLRHYANDFPATALRMYFTSNHDENSWCGTEFEKYGIWAKNLAVFSHTWCGVSMLYTGQELPVTRRLKSVSYTHLDVYKRQLLCPVYRWQAWSFDLPHQFSEGLLSHQSQQKTDRQNR